MTYRLSALLAAALAAGPSVAADPGPAPGRDRDAQLTKLLEQTNKATLAKLAAFYDAAAVDRCERCWHLVEADPTDAVAAKILVNTARLMPASAPRAREVRELLLAHHLANPEVADCFQRQSAQHPGGRDFLRAVLEQAPDRNVRAHACQRLAVGIYMHPLSKANELTTGWEAAAESEANTYLARLEREFPEERVTGGKRVGKVTYAEQARGILMRERDLAVGRSAPEGLSAGLDGKPVRISDLKGKVAVLDFWATWCGPCKAMIPHEREMVGRLKGKPFELVSISVDDEKEALTEFLGKTPMPWTHWYAGPGGLTAAWGVQSFPTIYVLDGKGVIRFKNVRGEELEKAVNELLKEAEAAGGGQ